MARLTLQVYLVNDDVWDPYEVGADDLRLRLIGNDTGAPVQSVALTLETDDGYTVDIGVPGPPKRRGGPEGQLRAGVRWTDRAPASAEEYLATVRQSLLRTYDPEGAIREAYLAGWKARDDGGPT